MERDQLREIGLWKEIMARNRFMERDQWHEIGLWKEISGMK